MGLGSTMLDVLCDSPILEALQRDHVKKQLSQRFRDPAALTRELLRIGWLTAYQVRQLLEGHGAELMLGQYVVLEPLGQGNMGQVFKARHHVMGRLVALKVVRPDRLKNPAILKRFRREVQAVSQLSHPNIVAAHDASEVNGVHFLVMEYVEGTELGNLVRDHGPLPLATAADYVRQAALGLQHAHERGMVHRDIKPANLLVTADGVIKILDMGLVRMIDPGDTHTSIFDLTRAGTVMGTPNYIAPEQALNPKAVDIRADIYSLGCTLYFLLTGQPPFQGDSLTAVLLKHQTEEPPPLQQFGLSVPPALLAIVQKMMAKNPADRYRNPQLAADALVPWAHPAAGKGGWVPPEVRPRPTARSPNGRGPSPLSSTDEALLATLDDVPAEPVRATDLAPAGALPYPPPRSRRWFVLAGVLAVLLLSAVLLVLAGPALLSRLGDWLGRGAGGLSSTTPSLLDGLDPERISRSSLPPTRWPELVAVLGEPRERGRVPSVAFTPKGDRLAVPGVENAVVIWDILRDQPWDVLKGHHTNTVNAVAISPDGKYLASAGEDLIVRLWAIDGDRPRPLATLPGHEGGVKTLAFSPDSRRLASGSADETVRTWAITADVAQADGAPLKMPAVVNAVAFTADGKSLAAAGRDEKVHIWDLTENPPVVKRTLINHSNPFTVVYSLAVAPDGKHLAAGTNSHAPVWDLTASAGSPSSCVVASNSSCRSVAFSPDSKWLAVAHSDNTVVVYDTAHRPKHSWKLLEPPLSVAFAPDGRHLAVGIDNGTVFIFRLSGP